MDKPQSTEVPDKDKSYPPIGTSRTKPSGGAAVMGATLKKLFGSQAGTTAKQQGKALRKKNGGK